MKNLGVWEKSEDELDALCGEIAKVLLKDDSFIVWLEGPMGAGKTTFVRHFLRSIGLSDRTPVASPTYTIVNEYQINSAWFAHLDLYRAEGNFSFAELGLDMKTYRGMFVEWFSLAENSREIRPTYKLEIEPLGEKRRYTLAQL